MKEIKAIIRPDRLSVVMRALHAMPDLPGVTISTVRGTGRRYPSDDVENAFDEVEMVKLEIVVPVALALDVVSAIERAAHTGRVGDGKIFVIPVEHAVKVRSGERDGNAL
ncbi:MAG: P-II family nitrogen regulator [Vicinamibacterales bacterium]